MQKDIDLVELQKLSQQLVDVATSEQFLKQMKVVIDTPAEKRFGEAANILTPDALKASGIDLPDFTRVSSRYFEDNNSNGVEFADIEGGRSILQRLHEINPDILDDLGAKDPELLRALSARGEVAGACACVGGGPSWSACVGVGL